MVAQRLGADGIELAQTASCEFVVDPDTIGGGCGDPLCAACGCDPAFPRTQ
jgi:hypothetical protein